MTTTKLVIARHGNTFAKGDVITRLGTTDLPLVESGEQQGRKLGAYLEKHNLPPDIAFTSTLKRTIRMAELAQEETRHSFPSHQRPLFNEIDYGIDENQPEEKVIERLGKDTLTRWDEEAILPEGWKADISAIIEGWKTFAQELITTHEGRTILVITSNGIARFAPYLTGDFKHFRTQHPLKLATGALGILEYDGDTPNWYCTGWNIRP